MLDFGLVSLCCSCAGIFGAGRWAVLGAGSSAGPGDLVPGAEQVASSLQRCEAGRQAAQASDLHQAKQQLVLAQGTDVHVLIQLQTQGEHR